MLTAIKEDKIYFRLVYGGIEYLLEQLSIHTIRQHGEWSECHSVTSSDLIWSEVFERKNIPDIILSSFRIG